MTAVALVIFLLSGMVITIMAKKREEKAPTFLENYFNKLVSEINSRQKRWKAKYNPNAFTAVQLNESNIVIRRAEVYAATAYQDEFDQSYQSTFHGRDIYQLTVDLLKNFHIPSTLATHFDAREHWPTCRSVIGRVYNQGACWHYWLYSTLSTIEDRLCIASNGEDKVKLSKYHILSCCQDCGTCRGGNPQAVYMYWVKYGVTSDTCQPSSKLLSMIPGSCGTPCPISAVKQVDRQLRLSMRNCYSDCFNSEYRYLDVNDPTQINVLYGDYVNLIQKSVISERHIKAWDGSEIVRKQMNVDASNWLDIVKKELLLRGPVSMDLTVHEDFLLYEKGIYEPIVDEANSELFRHHVKVIGWKIVENETIFIAVNTWGTSWGDEGLFYFPARLVLRGDRPSAYAPYATVSTQQRKMF